MNKLFYSLLLILSMTIGLLFHAYQKEWIILLLPFQTSDQAILSLPDHNHYEPKKIPLYFFKHEKWHFEETSIIWSSQITENITAITNNWLMLMEDEKIIDTDIQLLSAIITENKELFLSFNKDLFDKQSATLYKMMIIESLLKTLRENHISVQSVRFLVHHQTMIDDHINFNISWPMNGYIHSA